MAGKEGKEDDKADKQVTVVRNATDLQRLKLEKLMKNPDKLAFIPDRPKDKRFSDPAEFVRNVMGSSAGAGSGEFHVYRHIRRREYARQEFLQNCKEKDDLDEMYHIRLEHYRREMEIKASKNRVKRQRQKERQKAKRQKKNSGKPSESSSSESSEEEEETAPPSENKTTETPTTKRPEDPDITSGQEGEEASVKKTENKMPITKSPEDPDITSGQEGEEASVKKTENKTPITKSPEDPDRTSGQEGKAASVKKTVKDSESTDKDCQ